MIARLILVQSPHALPVLGCIAGAGRTSDEKAMLRSAMDSALAAVLAWLERDIRVRAQGIGNGPLVEAGAGVRRVLTLLSEIEADKSFANHWPRLKVIHGVSLLIVHAPNAVCSMGSARVWSRCLLRGVLVPVDGSGRKPRLESLRPGVAQAGDDGAEDGRSCRL